MRRAVIIIGVIAGAVAILLYFTRKAAARPLSPPGAPPLPPPGNPTFWEPDKYTKVQASMTDPNTGETFVVGRPAHKAGFEPGMVESPPAPINETVWIAKPAAAIESGPRVTMTATGTLPFEVKSYKLKVPTA